MTKQQAIFLFTVACGGLAALTPDPVGILIFVVVPLAIGIGLFYLIGLSAQKKPTEHDEQAPQKNWGANDNDF